VTLQSVIERWERRLLVFSELPCLVDARALCTQFISDLGSLSRTGAEHVFTLKEAARKSGYSQAHLGRLVRNGRIPNAGRPRAPRIRLGDVPCKPGYLPPERASEPPVRRARQQTVGAS